MAVSPAQPVIRFGLFELDPQSGQLSRQGIRLRLPQQPVQLLSVLLERPGEIFSREELHRRLWPSDVFVDFDHGLNKSIQKLREALGDSPASPRYIETIPRVGYRFIAPVHPSPVTEPADAPAPRPQSPANPPAGREQDTFASRRWWALLFGCSCLAAAFVIVVYLSRRPAVPPRYTRLTDFAESVGSPVLSPDGRILAFMSTDNDFMSDGPIYVMMLPNGEPRRITDDPRSKYALAFSPDSSRLAYTAMEPSGFSTYSISVFGGDPHLLLKNAAGLHWLDAGHYLFSRLHSGLHLGVVTSRTDGENVRDIYFPEHERGMAHYSYASPDRKSALVVAMNGQGEWEQCLLISLNGSSAPRRVGPNGRCTQGAWSGDGAWMYFNVWVDGQHHLWRQSTYGGAPQQLTFAPMEEDGLAVDTRDGSLITAAGVHESVLWLHDEHGERPISSEGDVAGYPAPPLFTKDDQFLFYLAHRSSAGPGMQLWRMALATGKSDPALPGIAVNYFDLSPDGKLIVYSPSRTDQTAEVWIAPADQSTSPRRVSSHNERWPHFGRANEILFIATEGNNNYLESMKLDGTGRTRLTPYPVHELQSVSPGRHWAIGVVVDPADHVQVEAIPLAGGPPRELCRTYCAPAWASNGSFLYIPLDPGTQSSAGNSIALPLGPNEELPALPKEGIKPGDDAGVVPGARIVHHAVIVPGKNPSYFAFVKTSVHQNLYRISIP
jgi:DNA-binding winged helix-turn-helix (wHTH) protein/Tol biopolymer transport system component